MKTLFIIGAKNGFQRGFASAIWLLYFNWGEKEIVGDMQGLSGQRNNYKAYFWLGEIVDPIYPMRQKLIPQDYPQREGVGDP